MFMLMCSMYTQMKQLWKCMHGLSVLVCSLCYWFVFDLECTLTCSTKCGGGGGQETPGQDLIKTC